MSRDADSSRAVPSPARASGAPGTVAALSFIAGWIALFSWRGLVSEPTRYLVPTLLVGLAMVLAGVGLRRLGVSAYVVIGVQTLVALTGLQLVAAGSLSLAGVLPAEASVRRTVNAVVNGGATLNFYTAPVEQNPAHTAAFLMACGLLVLLSVDVLASGLGRVPLVALPLLVVMSVPIAILAEPLSPLVFGACALVFLRLLGVEGQQRLTGWAGGSLLGSAASARLLWAVSGAAVVAALLLAPLVPVADLLDRSRGGGSGPGSGGNIELTTVNPMVRLRRDLVEQSATPMLFARTAAPDTGYVRTTVLDELTADAWRPSSRNLPPQNRAEGDLPSPPGLGPAVGGRLDDWELRLAPGFATVWLPLPYPTRSIRVEGNWRYDPRTLDVALVGDPPPAELAYSATALTPTLSADLLESTVSAPSNLASTYTRLPENLPDVLAARAREVTRGARSDYARAVALQDWFREDGGFRYSLDQRAGSGLELLAAFVTTDRVGYCEQFAAAMATMGRTLGIPSRVAVGFLDGSTQPDGRLLYTSDDRHAWPEMYFSGVGWVRFEPTPGQRTGASPAWTRQRAQPVPSQAPTPTITSAPRLPQDPTAADSSGSPGGQNLPWQPFAGLGLAVLLGLVPAGLRWRQRARRLGGRSARVEEGAWAELRATALDLGIAWPERRSPREQARSLLDQVPAPVEAVGRLEGLLEEVERGRYAAAVAPSTPAVEGRAAAATLVAARPRLDATEVRSTVETWRRIMAASAEPRRRWFSRLWPVSLARRAQ